MQFLPITLTIHVWYIHRCRCCCIWRTLWVGQCWTHDSVYFFIFFYLQWMPVSWPQYATLQNQFSSSMMMLINTSETSLFLQCMLSYLNTIAQFLGGRLNFLLQFQKRRHYQIWTELYTFTQFVDAVEISLILPVCVLMYSYMYYFVSVLFSFILGAQDFYHTELLKYYNVYVVQWLRERCLLRPHQKYVGAWNQPRKVCKAN